MIGYFLAPVLLLLLLVPAYAQSARAPKLSVEVRPSSADLLPGQSSVVMLRVQNMSGGPMKSVKLRWIANPSLQISPAEPQSIGPLAKDGEALWELTLTAVGEPTTQVDFIIEYQLESKDQFPQRGFVFSSLPVKPRPVEAVSAIASLALVSNLPTLNEFNEGSLYVQLGNTSDRSLQVSRILVRGPKFLALRAINPKKEMVKANGGREVEREIFSFLELDSTPALVPSDNFLPPKSNKVVELRLKATDKVLPGKYKILVETDLVSNDGKDQALTLVGSQEVDIGVYGEAAVTALTIASIPIFLFVPGYLMFVAFGWLWGIGQPDDVRTKLLPSTNRPQLLVGAITLSLLTILLYPHVTHLFHFERNLLTGYGLRDIIWVWFGSIMAGVVAFGFWWIGARLWNWWQVERKTPKPTDTRGELLEKILRRQLGPRLEVVKVTDQGKNALLLDKNLSPTSQVWVGPLIRVVWTGKANEEYKKLLRDLLEDPKDWEDFKSLVQALRQAEEGGKIQLSQDNNWIDKPTELASDKVKPVGSTMLAVMEQD